MVELIALLVFASLAFVTWGVAGLATQSRSVAAKRLIEVTSGKPAELIASTKTVDEIRKFIAADSLGYLSLESMLISVEDDKRFCSACFTDRYPTEVGREDRQKELFGRNLVELLTPPHDDHKSSPQSHGERGVPRRKPLGVFPQRSPRPLSDSALILLFDIAILDLSFKVLWD